MKITALTENTSSCGLPVEHGLCLYIETESMKILFDAGQGELFSKNAKTLGVDIAAVDVFVLSHGHYDHGGGIETFLGLNNKAPVYISRRAFEPYYGTGGRYIGLDPKLKDSGRIIFTDDETHISDGISLYSCNDRKKAVKLGSFGLCVMRGGELLPDDFLHEQYMLIREKEKSVLISGCSHKGIINIADWFSPDVLIGGFHFSGLPLDDTLKGYAEALDAFDTVYYTCHCTGTAQYEFMKRYMRRLNYISAGQTVVF
ncbi:MAG: MBL fold metallo-hydrolase [Clostridia bacterium]|nr:MBL fold metallo-hydrolase [Clostridia bacterium]